MNRLEERKILRAIYPTTPNAEIAQMLGISVALVAKRARENGLRKDPKYLSKTNRNCGLHSPIAKKWK
jgi:FixJ family two-component response regulator